MQQKHASLLVTGEIQQLLPHACESEMTLYSGSEHGQATGYDVILMAETICSISAQRNLYGLIKCMSHPLGVIYMAGKKHYFGVGGGTRQFLSMLEKDGSIPQISHRSEWGVFVLKSGSGMEQDGFGVMAASLVTEVADGSSNVREEVEEPSITTVLKSLVWSYLIEEFWPLEPIGLVDWSNFG